MTAIHPTICPKCGKEITQTDIVLKHIKYCPRRCLKCGKDITPLDLLNKHIPNCNIIQRADGRMEWQCKHGVGHTIYSPDNDYTHGCDSCCASKEFKTEMKKWTKKNVIKK
jgi:hypothetical protein